MKWLVLVHVLSSIIGVGPTFFAHVLLRRSQTLPELRSSLAMNKKLELFPKVGGSLAVLSGLALFFAGEYGKFTQMWLLGSLILYVIIQIIVIAIITPRANRLSAWVFDPHNAAAAALPAEQSSLHAQVNRLFYAATACGVLLFSFMIMKP
ncbi:DUF2269 family protein [Paenibacillus cymbidii]|uniref:DUF2269 family protein n=1 Tax=Paenibacillus cymbidii TaxID=1639034 RepID=UPI001081C09C|nr:DUF2269 family protein [Paenibacillus cymbidii]